MLSAVVSIVAGITGCSVTITKQMSSHPCDGHFGCFSNNTMWVEDGCRGVFTCNGVTNVLCDPCDPGPCGGSVAVCPCSPPSPPPPAPKYLLLDDRNVIDTTATLVLGKGPECVCHVRVKHRDNRCGAKACDKPCDDFWSLSGVNLSGFVDIFSALQI